MVLEGTFVDAYGSFPTGTYVHNPPTSRHTPSAPDGAVILVKLHQFDPEDRNQFHVDTTHAADIDLHSDDREHVEIKTLSAGETFALGDAGGQELFVLEGSFTEAEETFSTWDWLRLPMGATSTLTAGASGARVWIKSGHLTQVSAPA